MWIEFSEICCIHIQLYYCGKFAWNPGSGLIRGVPWMSLKSSLKIPFFPLKLIGVALIAIGSIALSKFDVIGSLDGLGSIDSFTYSTMFIPIVVIALGCVVFIISFCGCCGAIRESQCMLMSYAVFLLVLVIGVAVGMYFAFTSKDDFVNESKNAYTLLFNSRNESLTSKALDNVQKAVSIKNGILMNSSWLNLCFPPPLIQLKCCGKNSFNDFLNTGNNMITSSCCDSGMCNQSNSYEGCHQALDSLITNSFNIILYVAGGLAVVMVIF